MNLEKRKGRANVFGDNIPHDGGVMAFDIVLSRTTDPAQLIPHLFEEIDPELSSRIKPGDIVVAGKNFLAGKAHNAGLVAMKALNMSILCESMPTRALQGVVALALPALTQCEGITAFIADGDEIEVDLTSGEVNNLTQGKMMRYPCLDPAILDLIERDGMRGMLVEHLRTHPELGSVRR